MKYFIPKGYRNFAFCILRFAFPPERVQRAGRLPALQAGLFPVPGSLFPSPTLILDP